MKYAFAILLCLSLFVQPHLCRAEDFGISQKTFEGEGTHTVFTFRKNVLIHEITVFFAFATKAPKERMGWVERFYADNEEVFVRLSFNGSYFESFMGRSRATVMRTSRDNIPYSDCLYVNSETFNMGEDGFYHVIEDPRFVLHESDIVAPVFSTHELDQERRKHLNGSKASEPDPNMRDIESARSLNARLDSIHIHELHLDEVSVKKSIGILQQQIIANDPHHRGIQVVLDADTKDSTDSPRISLSLADTSALEALNSIVGSSGLHRRFENGAIHLSKHDLSPIYRILYRFTPEQLKVSTFPPQPSQKLDDGRYDLTPWLTDMGVPSPPGASSICNQKDSTAIFVNTYDNLQLIITLFSPLMEPPKLQKP